MPDKNNKKESDSQTRIAELSLILMGIELLFPVFVFIF